MKLKYILITIGSMLLLIGLLTFFDANTPSQDRSGQFRKSDTSASVFISVIGLGTLLTGVFWKKQ